MDNYTFKIGTHDHCGGDVMSTQFPSGANRYCTKCGNFGGDNTLLASKTQLMCLIAIGYENQFTCSADCEVLDPSDGPECLGAIMKAHDLSAAEVDEVLVINRNEVAYHHGGQEGFVQKKPKVA